MKCHRYHLLFFHAFLILSVASCGSGDSEADGTASAPPEDSSVTEVIRKPESGIAFYSASHILIPSSIPYSDPVVLEDDQAYQTALDLRRQIQEGAVTYRELFHRYSADSTDISAEALPSFTAGGITEELSHAARTLEPGEVSSVIVTRFGYHIMKRLE